MKLIGQPTINFFSYFLTVLVCTNLFIGQKNLEKPFSAKNFSCLTPFKWMQLRLTAHILGLPDNCSEDMLKYFFENRRKSGGDKIKELKILPERTVITFFTNEGKHQSVVSKTQALQQKLKMFRLA